MKDLDRIIDLAKFVRAAFEKHAKGNSTLCCYCYRASLELFCLAKDEGIDIKLAGNTSHVFCIFCDTIIDITATQFNHSEKIAIGKVGSFPPGKCFDNYWKVLWSGSSLDEANEISGWFLDIDHERDRKMILEELNYEETAMM